MPISPNKAAGELEISLDGNTYILRPSFAAIVEFEDRAGMSVFEAMRIVAEKQSAPFKAVAAAFYAGIRASWKGNQRPPSYDEVGGAIYRDGVAHHLAAYVEFLSNSITGEKAQRKAAEEAAQGKDQTQPPTIPS